MGYALLMLLGGGVLWLTFLGIQLIAFGALLTIGLALMVIAAIYGFCFLGLFFILGETNTGWAIFGAMGLGTGVLAVIKKHFSNTQ